MEDKELSVFLNCLRSYADYWASVKLDAASMECMEGRGESEIHYRLDGLVHSILCLFDGVSAANDFHMYDIQYQGKTFNDCYMHDMYFKQEK